MPMLRTVNAVQRTMPIRGYTFHPDMPPHIISIGTSLPALHSCLLKAMYLCEFTVKPFHTVTHRHIQQVKILISTWSR